MAKIRCIQVEDAIGLSLSHDMPQIETAEGYQGPRFKKGQIIREEDLPALKSMGQDTISILELEEGEVYRDDAALRMADRLMGGGVEADLSEEGEVSLTALWNGLLVYDEDSIHKINENPHWVVAAVADRIGVKKGEKVAAINVAPLTMKEEQVLLGLEEVHPLSVFPFAPLKTALVTAERKLTNGRIRGGFPSKLEKKLAAFGTTLMGQRVVGGESEEVSEAILSFIGEGADLVITTGDMGEDPEDHTHTAEAISSIADDVRFRGVPIIPGASLMLAIRGEAKIVGAPDSVARHEWTSLDPLLIRIFAGLIPTAGEVRQWGAGGLCRKCRECNYPYCHFAAR